MVGAFNVGKIVTRLAPDLSTNRSAKKRAGEVVDLGPGVPVEVAEELGIFMLGSTVVLVFGERDIERRSFFSL